MDVDEIDPFAKERIRMVLDALAEIDQVMSRPTREMKRGVAYIENLLAGRPLAEQIRILRDPEARMRDSGGSGPDPDLLREILDWILRMLEDGAGTIYSPDFGFYKIVQSGQAVPYDVVGNIKDADNIGAGFGGFVGTMFPVVGTAGGAASGGAGASARAAIAELIKWLF